MPLIELMRRLVRRREPELFPLPGVWYEGGDGSTVAEAIIIRGAQLEIAGIAAAFNWMHRHIGPKDVAWRLETHAAGSHGGRNIDTFRIVLPDGKPREVFFDVTESFGERSVNEVQPHDS